ncbi:hypothetical protein EDB87DRAFT_1577040 [Lactarius vividus]|nr:hypothetical protein EDB87DRAFT_1577040 [Lactarius vividus]
MADIKIWCLVIDHEHNPTFGEPFPVTVHYDDTIHDLKIKIMGTQHSPDLHRVVVSTNSIEIWKGGGLKSTSTFSARNCLHQTGMQICELDFSESDDGPRDVWHLGAGQKLVDLELEDNEILLALVPLSESG